MIISKSKWRLKRRLLIGVLLTALIVVVFGSCDILFGSGGGGGSSGSTAPPVGNWDAAVWTEHGSITGSSSVTVDGAYAGRNLFYVFTNAGSVPVNTTLPSASVVGSSLDGASIVTMNATADGLVFEPALAAETTPSPAQRGHPRITEANARLSAALELAGPGALAVTAGTDYNVDDTETMIAWTNLDGSPVPATVDVRLAAKATQASWDFYIWLVTAATGNESLVATDADGDLTNANIQEMADIFLDSTTDADIFDLVTNAFGDPWGSHPYSNLVSGAERNVHVLLYDIEGDGEFPENPGEDESRIVGFFYGVDNFTDEPGNRLVMFHLDAALFGQEDTSPPGPWSITDYWPAQVVSTLAHEFQHMIHFYQRGIVSPDGSLDGSFQVWLNEANSMMAEDLVAEAIENDGPRGVAYTDGSAGSVGNSSGRLPGYNAVGSLTDLTGWTNSLDNYSISYAFGAYVGRVYGAQFFTNLFADNVASGSSFELQYTTAAIARTASAMGSETVDFAEILRRWGVAYLVSDDTNVPVQYRINRGDWFTSTAGSETYRLGSINAYNYTPLPIWRVAAFGSVPVAPAANGFVIAGTVPTGGYTVAASLPALTTLTVLTR